MNWVFGILAALSAICFGAGWWSKNHEQAADDQVGVALLYLAGGILGGCDIILFAAASLWRIWFH